MRVVDYIMETLADEGVKDIFTLTGGGAMFLNDAMAQSSRLNTVCNHHEQASAMAAVGYAKFKNDLAAVVITSGCGATNTITGLLDAWQDSVPVIFISGQIKLKETSRRAPVPLRQFGVQEADIVSLVQPLTKYAVMVETPEAIGYHLEKAIRIARQGRPGPVWLDIPQDIQAATIELSTLDPFDVTEDIGVTTDEDELATLTKAISESSRPIVIAGNGIRLSDQVPAFRQFIENHGLPVAVSYLGADLLTQDNDLYVGRLGNKGDRAGNFAVANADLIISLGCRLSVALTGFEYELFGRGATLVVVDIDAEEHQKNTVQVDHFIHSDLKDFFQAMGNTHTPRKSAWVSDCNRWKQSWPVTQDHYPEPEVNKYQFIKALSTHLKDDSVVVSDAGSAYYVTSQGLLISTDKQRYITSGAQAEMGFSLPAAIGACVARGNQEVLAITGDGSLQLNLQELQTVVHHQLKIKLFVWNNNGYLSIRATQTKFFEGRLLGTDAKSGLTLPNLGKIADAYGIAYLRIETESQLESVLAQTLAHDGPVICEVFCPEAQEIIPAVAAMKRQDGTMVSKPMEDMYPYLSREEFHANMKIKPLDD